MSEEKPTKPERKELPKVKGLDKIRTTPGGARAAVADRVAARTGKTPGALGARVGAGTGTAAPSGIGAKTGAAGSPAGRGGLIYNRGGGNSYFLEKQAVVLDFGRAQTKVGFATESRPRHVFATPELRDAHVSGKAESSSRISPGALKEEWIPVLEDLLGRIFLYYLNSNPKERRVIICDAVDASSAFRSALAFVLFNRFAVPAVNFVTSLTLPLYLTGLSTGVVIDAGYDATRVMATYAGVPIISAFSAAAAAGRHINARLESALDGLPGEKEEKSEAEVEDIIEDIKARTCFVKCTFPGNITLDTLNAGEYQLGHKVVKVPATARSRCMEVLFAGGSSGNEPGLPADVDSAESVPQAFCKMLEKCPVDVRPMVVQNIVICGGCAMVRGLVPRLVIELQQALLQHEGLKALADRLQFSPVEFAPTFCIWMGGAVFGSLEGATDYTSEEYMSGKPIPDWASEGFV